MEKHSNTHLLSSKAGPKFKKGKSNNLNIVFDEKSRAEYLTGFQKRNKEKKKSYVEKQKALLHQEKIEKRREKRKRLRDAITTFISTESEIKANTTASESKEIKLKFEDDSTPTTVLIEEL